MKTSHKLLPFLSIIFLLYGFITLKTPVASETGISELLTQGMWTEMESWKDMDGDGIFVYDTDSCQADNNWLFNPDSTLVMTEDVLKCEEEMPFLDTINFHWQLIDNETVLRLISDAIDLDLEIYSIGEHELTLLLIDSKDPNAATWEKIILRR